MNEKTELTASDLAPYLGCEVLDEYGELSMLVGVIRDETIKIRNLKTGAFIFVFSKSVKPVLRPPSSITQDEMRENNEVYKAAASSIGLLIHGTAAATRHYLSLHIDLFGWIEAGLAIDKTKTP